MIDSNRYYRCAALRERLLRPRLSHRTNDEVESGSLYLGVGMPRVVESGGTLLFWAGKGFTLQGMVGRLVGIIKDDYMDELASGSTHGRRMGNVPLLTDITM
jgi:hypothetical protein